MSSTLHWPVEPARRRANGTKSPGIGGPYAAFSGAGTSRRRGEAVESEIPPEHAVENTASK